MILNERWNKILMNFKLRLTIILLSVSMNSLSLTACGKTAENDSSSESYVKSAISTKPIMTETVENTTSYIANSKSEEFTEKEIVKEVSSEVYTINELCYEDDNIDRIMNNPKTLNQQVLGNISDEDDAKEKGRTVFIQLWGQKYIDAFESDYVTIDDNPVQFERDSPPYRVTYYEKFDVWMITMVKRSGKTVDGIAIATPGLSSFVIIRGNDGKVLAVD